MIGAEASLAVVLCLAVPVNAQMVVHSIATGIESNPNVTSQTGSHALRSGSNRILIVGISLRTGQCDQQRDLRWSSTNADRCCLKSPLLLGPGCTRLVVWRGLT